MWALEGAGNVIPLRRDDVRIAYQVYGVFGIEFMGRLISGGFFAWVAPLKDLTFIWVHNLRVGWVPKILNHDFGLGNANPYINHMTSLWHLIFSAIHHGLLSRPILHVASEGWNVKKNNPKILGWKICNGHLCKQNCVPNVEPPWLPC